jgi:hypothetical protein
MFDTFKSAHFSMTGQAHRLAGVESQDSGLCEIREHAVLLNVSDGVSGAEDSRVGSMVVTRAVRGCIVDVEEQLLAFARKSNPIEFAGRFVPWINRELHGELAKAKRYLGGDDRAASSLSATLMSCLLVDAVYVVFGCGDGVFAVNGEIFSVSSPKENCPDLPIYGVGTSPEPDARVPLGQIRALHCGWTKDLDSVMVGTDGVLELLPALARRGSPGSPLTVDSIESLVARSLAVSSNAVLPKDDATLVGAWRIPSGGPADRAFPTGE